MRNQFLTMFHVVDLVGVVCLSALLLTTKQDEQVRNWRSAIFDFFSIFDWL